MTWNYRVVETEGTRSIHEIYYDEHGNIEGYADIPSAPMWNPEFESFEQIIELMKLALDKPVILKSELIKMFESENKS